MTDFAAGENRPAELVAYSPGVKLIASVRWSFSYEKRERKTDTFYANLAEKQELERILRKKEIPNLLKTLGKLRGDADLLTRNLELLSLTLASESCSRTDGPLDGETHALLSNMAPLLMCFRSIFIEFKKADLPVSAMISLMRCCTYLKIIAKGAGNEHLLVFQKAFHKAGLFPFVLEHFEEFKAKSRLLSLKVLSFVTYTINDMHSLYFQNLSGVRLEPLIGYATLNETNSADSEILQYHCQFVSAVCYCLFEHEPQGEDAQLILLMDVK